MDFFHLMADLCSSVLSFPVIILTIVAYLVTIIWVKPWLWSLYYKRQGLYSLYYPISGIGHQFDIDTEKHDDSYYTLRRIMKQNPKLKGLITNTVGHPTIALTDPKLIKEFFTKEHIYAKPDECLGFTKDFLQNGLAFAHGNDWKDQRKLLTQIFHYDFLKQNTPLIHEVACKHLEKLSKQADLNNVVLRDTTYNIAGEVIGRLFFGKDLSALTYEGKDATRTIGDLMKDIYVLLFHPLTAIFGQSVWKIVRTELSKSVEKKIKDFRAICLQMINDRRNSPQKDQTRPDILDLFLAKQQELGIELIPDSVIVDNFLTFFQAGMDTSSLFMTYVTYCLVENPEWQQKIEDEGIHNYASEQVTIEKLNTLQSMDLVLKETARIYGPSKDTFVREALEDNTIGDIKVKKNTWVFLMFGCLHANPMYFEDPEKFNPARWADETKELPEYFFSGGPRNCIGRHLALIQVKVVVTEVFKKFKVSIADGYKLRIRCGQLYEPVEDIRFKLQPK
jgi:cytochrome P450